MNYIKIKEQVYNAGYCDERKIICHSYRSYAKTDNYLIMMGIKEIRNSMRLPQFHILSLKDDKLYISYATMFGGFKKYYASIKLDRLQYKFSRLVDKTVMVHCFELDDDERKNKSEFYIIAIKNKDDAQLLVDAIKEYNKQ